MQALKGRDKKTRDAVALRCSKAALSGLIRSDDATPRVSPWAVLLRPVGAVSTVKSNPSPLTAPNKPRRRCVEQRGFHPGLRYVAPLGLSWCIALRLVYRVPWGRCLRSGRTNHRAPYSHSIVAGGFEEMSYTTRFTPSTSLITRLEILPSTSWSM